MDNRLSRLIKAINKQEVVDILKNLISIAGHINIPGQEKEISDYVFNMFNTEGIEVTRQQVEPDRNNIIAKIPGRGEGKTLTFNGHLDTVPPNEDMKDYHPRTSGGKIYGLGSADMKGGVAAMAYALILVNRLGLKLEGDLYFTGVIGEESGGTGTGYLINESGFTSDYTVVGEPTELRIVNSHKGVSRYQAAIRGKAVHASMPHKGLNAIRAMSRFISILDEEYVPQLDNRTQPRVGSATLNYGIIQGGKDVNIVADKCILKIDRRWTESEKDNDLIAELKPYLEKACSLDKGFKYDIVSLLPPDSYYGPFYLEENHDFVTRTKEAFRQVGTEPEICGMQGWTDGATILHKGYPALIIGPGSMDNAHTAGEFIIINELIEAVKLYLALICEICIPKN